MMIKHMYPSKHIPYVHTMLRLLSKVQSSTTACVAPVVPRMLRTAEVMVFW